MKSAGEKYCTDWLCSKYNWRHNNDVIFVKISLNVANEIPYKTYISDFENWQNDIVLLLIYDTTLVYNKASIARERTTDFYDLPAQYWPVVYKPRLSGP